MPRFTWVGTDPRTGTRTAGVSRAAHPSQLALGALDLGWTDYQVWNTAAEPIAGISNVGDDLHPRYEAWWAD